MKGQFVMKKKNKAAKTVNTALGLIILVMVILCSPLFGYARGIAPKERRVTTNISGETTETSPVWLAAAETTPRPTAPPTPTPVVLPTAPPTPVPTPVPQHTPQPVVQRPAVQQPAYDDWQPEQQYQPEPDYVEPEPEEQEPETQYDDVQPQNDTGGQIITDDGSSVIQNENADLVINLPSSEAEQSSAISVTFPDTGAGGDTGDSGGDIVFTQPSQDSNEAEPLPFG